MFGMSVVIVGVNIVTVIPYCCAELDGPSRYKTVDFGELAICSRS